MINFFYYISLALSKVTKKLLKKEITLIEISQKCINRIFFRIFVQNHVKRIVKKNISLNLRSKLSTAYYFSHSNFSQRKKKINNVTIHRTISLPFLPLSTYVPCTRKTTLNAFPRSQAAINISRYAVWVSYRNTGVQTTSERTYSSYIFIEKSLDKTRLEVARLVHG